MIHLPSISLLNPGLVVVAAARVPRSGITLGADVVDAVPDDLDLAKYILRHIPNIIRNRPGQFLSKLNLEDYKNKSV